MDGSITPHNRVKGSATALVLVGVALAVAPGGSVAATAADPEISRPPSIEGKARVGEELEATGARWSPADAQAQYYWLRCEADDPRDCTAIERAVGRRYKVVAADLGSRLRVWLTVSNNDGRAHAVSEATDPVKPEPEPEPTPEPTPDPTPEPTPDPPPEPDPEPSPSPDPEPSPSPEPQPADPAPQPPGTPFTSPPAPQPVVSQPAAAAPTAPELLRPFPSVRMSGRLTPNGAEITYFRVRAPEGVRISVRCRGEGCPRRRWAKSAAVTRLRAYERRLRAGTRLTITVTRRGWIGKHTTIIIRRGRAPHRLDRCLYPGKTRPTRCPD